MEAFPFEISSPPDDPSACEHAQWHGLVHMIVGGSTYDRNPATGKFESVPAVFRVMKAAVSQDSIFLFLRRWFPSAVPRSQEFWVGGRRDPGYGLAFRPDGGFQVVGEKYIPMNDRIINSMSTELTSGEFEELLVFLNEAV